MIDPARVLAWLDAEIADGQAEMAKQNSESGESFYSGEIMALKRARVHVAALAQAPAAPPTTERDPIVMAAEAGRASCIAALERAIKTARILPGTLPLTAQECVQILRVIPLGLAPIEAAPGPASAGREE